MGKYFWQGKKKFGYKGLQGSGKFFVNDKEVTEEEFRLAFPAKEIHAGEDYLSAQGSATWPMVSEALAVHPAQVDAANERARKAGIGARYQKGTGLCQIDSPREKTRLVNLEGYVDKQKGYS